MADSVGSLVDKLITVDMKLWNCQDNIYFIRKMQFSEFKEMYSGNDEKLEELFNYLKKATDLNNQRSQLVNEIDGKIIEMIKAAQGGDELDNGSFLQRGHKTY